MDPVASVALVGCSDPLPQKEKEDVKRLIRLLEQEGLRVIASPLLFAETPPAPAEKAAALNRAFRTPDVGYIFDVSGGDLANLTLPCLDFNAIAASRALFFGFSDLTVLLNAILAKTERRVVNYQIRNLLYGDAAAQLAFFREKLLPMRFTPADLAIRFLRGDSMRGKVFGGNVRCFLKLAGTPYWPNIDGGILLLESLGGGVYQMATALEQYRQMGVFDRIQGILLGTFTKMEEEKLSPSIEELVLGMTPANVAVAATPFIGHYPNARPIALGKELTFTANPL